MTDYHKVAQWLGVPYTCVDGAIYDTGTVYRLDDDQLLGAILRRAAELELWPVISVSNDKPLMWSAVLWAQKGAIEKAGSTPLAAALAAVEAL